MKNFFDIPVPGPVDREIFTEIVNRENVRIERIVSAGQVTPDGEWYDQDEHEWVVLLQGKAKLEFETGETIDLDRGSHLYLPPHCKHRITFTSAEPPCIWLAVFWR